MTALIVLGCILLILFLIGMIRVGASVDYSEAGLFVNIKLGPMKLQVVPIKKRKKKIPQNPVEKPAEENAAPAKKKNLKDTLSLAMRFIPLVGEAAGQFRRKIRIDDLRLHLIWGSADPASAAMGFGAGHAAMGILWPAFEHNFHVRKHDLHVGVDFERAAPSVQASIQATLTVGQAVILGLRIGIKALKIYLGFHREHTTVEKAVQL